MVCSHRNGASEGAGSESGNSNDHSEGHLGEPTNGSGPDFTHSANDNVSAADGLANGIEPDTAKAGGWADEATAALVTAFGAKDGHGWLTSSAASKAHSTWGEQVQGLVSRLTLDESALRTALTFFEGTDIDVGNGMRTSSIQGL